MDRDEVVSLALVLVALVGLVGIVYGVWSSKGLSWMRYPNSDREDRGQ